MDSITTQQHEMNSGDNPDEIKTGGKHRKKHYYNTIREQMEFYFGDANLSKDRFLMQLIKNDPYVPLDVFLKFNKIKKLTNSVDHLSTALENCSLLELSEDKTKVRRKIELPVDRNADEKTIYIESLPPNIDHDWVIKMFNRFGRVEYVSLPKYKRSHKFKGFGFVEFENESSVEKALRAFKEFDGVICGQSLDPAELQSIKSFIKEQKELEADNAEEMANNSKSEEIEIKQDSQDTIQNPSKRKLECTDEDSESTDEEPVKKSRIGSEIEKVEENPKESTSSCKGDEKQEDYETPLKKLKVASDNEATDDLETSESDKCEDKNGDTNPNEVDKSKKKNRQHRKRKSKQKSNDSNFQELKIMSKKDWKRLRNKYLNLQRQKISKFKALRRNLEGEQQQQQQNNQQKSHFRRAPFYRAHFYRSNENLDNASDDKVDNDLAGNQSNDKQYTAHESELKFHFEPGLIVHIKFLEPCEDVKSFKSDMRQYKCVQYVDVNIGAIESYLRCDKSANAKELVNQISCAEYQCKILTGSDEQEYWKKIMRDREMKLNKKVKSEKKRGREKVAKAIAKHIYFEDENE